jgi:hypothetical protein
MNYILFIIPLLIAIAIYLKMRNKLPNIGYINTKEHMVNYKVDYMVQPIRNNLAELKSETNRPINGTCDLYGAKQGSTHVPPAFLYHDKEVWIDSDLLQKKVRAIRKAVEDKGTWEHTKMNTYIDKTTKPYDTSDNSYMANQPLDQVQRAQVDGDTTSFTFSAFGPKNKNPFSTVDGYTPLYTTSPKHYYEFSKDYGFHTYK